MVSDAAMEKMQLRQSYQNMWHTNLLGSIKKDTPFMCYRNCRAPVGQDAEGKTKYVIRPLVTDFEVCLVTSVLFMVYPGGKMSRYFASLKPGDVVEVKGYFICILEVFRNTSVTRP
ncbi:hypothetical protein Patl1_14474 [Pistacia atlantica]|uniref:Uncharacterized protein n=1 Tax=Pistacia atlantica TaxID=434234 RepID=A0ACC1AUE1_9ROSI|nr:hypothetical protein Patl1_14474 [Pistacia atlantica]